MYPVLFRFELPGTDHVVTLYSYGFMILVGIVAAYLSIWMRRKPYNLNHDKISEIFIWAFVGVFVGGKLFFYFEDVGRYLSTPADLFKDLGSGFVFYGSFLVGIPLLVWRFRKMQLPVMPMLDLIAIAGALVHGFGKIGCLLSGCCHGKICEPGRGITYTHPESSADPLNTPLYPTQIYDAILIFGIVALLLFYYNRKQFHGQLLLLYAIVYGVGRTITEIYRGDEERGYIIADWLSHSQFIALLILAASGYLWKRWKRTQAVSKQ